MANHDIEAAKGKLRDAKLAYNAAVLTAQEQCNHPRVYESPAYQICTDGRYFMARRVCECCGLHEFGGWGSKATRYGSSKWVKYETSSWHSPRGKSVMDSDFVCPTTKEELVKMVIEVECV